MTVSSHERCLYVQLPGSKLSITDGRWTISLKGEKVQEVPAGSIRRICIFGNVQITSPVIVHCVRNRIPLHVLSQFGQYQGAFHGKGSRLCSVRYRQYQLRSDACFRQRFACTVISGKIRNQIAFLNQVLRNHPERKELLRPIFQLKSYLKKLNSDQSVEHQLGIEGLTTRIYFSSWGKAIQSGDFSFSRRLYRPAPDPVNSMLNLGYALLTSRIDASLQIHGLDSAIGLVHAVRGYPALACDLIEEFRTAIVDSFVIKVINKRQFKPEDFIVSDTGSRRECTLTDEARKRFIKAFEEKLMTKRKHGTDKPMSWIDIIDSQVKAFKRFVTGKSEEYIPYKTV